MADEISTSHHYVPIWYQRQFLQDRVGEFWVLDKQPVDQIVCPDGQVRSVRPRRIGRRGPIELFQKEDLYSVSFEGVPIDILEKFVFGDRDNWGARILPFFANWPLANGMFITGEYSFPEWFGHPTKRMSDLAVFMDIQKLRTPRGIDQVKLALTKLGIPKPTNNDLMTFLLQRQRTNCTVWMEAIWEIFSIPDDSTTGLLLSDDPVTYYNMDCYPTSEPCLYPREPRAFWRGTRVLYPLSRKKLLVLTHVEHMDRPRRSRARTNRTNARSFDQAIASYTHIQNDRVLSDDQVLTINYAIKARAVREVASTNKDDLFPEDRLVSTPTWSQIDEIFQPRHRTYHSESELLVQYNDDSMLFSDAHGQRHTVPSWFVRQHRAKPKQT